MNAFASFLKLTTKDYIYIGIIAVLILLLLLKQKPPAQVTAAVITEKKTQVLRQTEQTEQQATLLAKSKDTVIAQKALVFLQETEKIRFKLDNGGLSIEEQKLLVDKLLKVENDFRKLSIEYQGYQNTIMDNLLAVEEKKDFQMEELNAKIDELEAELSIIKEHKPKEIYKHTQAHFTALALNKRNLHTFKSRYVTAIECELRLSENHPLHHKHHLKIEITDPDGKILTTDKELMLLEKGTKCSYVFKPDASYNFRSGSYHVRAHDEEKKIELQYDLVLNNKF